MRNETEDRTRVCATCREIFTVADFEMPQPCCTACQARFRIEQATIRANLDPVRQAIYDLSAYRPAKRTFGW